MSLALKPTEQNGNDVPRQASPFLTGASLASMEVETVAEISFKLPSPEYRAYTWILQDEHTPASQTPLIASTRGPLGALDSGVVPNTIQINGYNYQKAGSPAPFGRLQEPQTVDDLVRWRREWIPQVEELAQRLESFDPCSVPPGSWANTLEELSRENQRVFSGVHSTAVGPARMAVDKFANAYVQYFGDSRRQDALALVQGFPNLSVERASALWELSRLARQNPDLRAAFETKSYSTAYSSSLEEFKDKLSELLNRFGSTSNNGKQDEPTWREDPWIPLELILRYAEQDDQSNPAIAAERQHERRLVLERELHDLAYRDATVAAMIPLLDIAQQFLPNLEDHNLLADQRLHYASRKRWLAIGDYLVNEGHLASPEDVFYYTYQELLSLLEGASPLGQDVIANRRHVQELYRSTTPPATLGKPPERDVSLSSNPSATGRRYVLKGVAASPGTYTATARIIDSLEDIHRLNRGDILVCRSTTPPWSPFFAIAGAIVTNTGGALSHGAVVAREFGIPAVVGLRDATSLIPDGITVTIDGGKGLVVVGLGPE